MTDTICEDGVYTYDDGVWRRVLDLDRGYGKHDFCVTARSRAFLAAPPSKANPPGGPETHILVSDDCGATWHKEDIRYPDPVRWFYYSGALVRAGGEGVFVNTLVRLPPQLVSERRRYATVIFARDEAPAGQGSYGPAFESETGDYFGYISAMAFRSADEGYAVGPYTSVALERGEWHVEAWEKSFSPWLEEVVAGPSGYWAVGMPRYEGPRRLYHIP